MALALCSNHRELGFCSPSGQMKAVLLQGEAHGVVQSL